MSYAIEVGRIEATVVDRNGSASPVTFFLHTVSPHQFTTETLADRLNDPATEFLPCEIDGQTELLRLSSMAYVEIPGAAPELRRLEEIGAARTPVRLVLDGGFNLEGELVYEAPATTNRVSDLLNERASRFLLLDCGDRTLFVRRDAVSRVRV